MRKKKLPASKRDCHLCFEFTLGEFTEEQVKICAEHWMDAEHCPNWKPVDVFIEKRRRLKKIIWIDKKMAEEKRIYMKRRGKNRT